MIPRHPEPVRSPPRRLTRAVQVGEVGIGGVNPLRVQSMTTTDTLDVRATADQIERLVDVGCEIVRVTAPGKSEAEQLGPLVAELARRRVLVPIVADIHFAPNAAKIAAEFVDKVRINPGNYADKKRFEIREYSDEQYREELERVGERFRPLVRRCKELGRALRIGTNHGSLSDRIMNRYGDTPQGMVESALEFLAVCEDEDYHDVIFSMKASNPQVAIHAYRMLAARLAEREGPSYPFHLGVTEAGDGEDGRIKSAIGIGALLEDGIGDTIRVSLTEDPVREIPVARRLADRYDARWQSTAGAPDGSPGSEGLAVRALPHPYSYERRASRCFEMGPISVGGEQDVRAEIDLGPLPEDPALAARSLAGSLRPHASIDCEGVGITVADPAAYARAERFAETLARQGLDLPLVVRAPAELVKEARRLAARLVIPVTAPVSGPEVEQRLRSAEETPIEWELSGGDTEEAMKTLARVYAGHSDFRWLLSLRSPIPVHALRRAAALLCESASPPPPIVLRAERNPALELDAALLVAATDVGTLLCDGIGDLVVLSGFGDPGRTLERTYRILQGARLRTTWTEFISCPSCGRTLFDLEETTARIKQRTDHLRGVKIAIMGCIVNGPGEMADADFGYVGSGPGRVNLYVGQQLVERHLAADRADERLVELIREHGRWIDP